MPAAVPTTSSIDKVLLKCANCSVVTTRTPATPFTTARAMKLWIQAQPAACPNCGSKIRALSTHVAAVVTATKP